jgi:leucyl-tRNA synthetase
MDVSRPWATKDVVGAQRFLQRMWRNVVAEETGAVNVSDDDPDEATLRALHKAIDGVHADYANMRFNTAGAKLIELNNHVTKTYGSRPAPRSVVEPMVLMLAPLCPHAAEEMWERLGHSESLAHGPFPIADEKYLVEDTIEYPIQVNGKVRARITVATSASQDEVKSAALAEEKVAALINGGEPKKVIVVPGRLVNVVV